LGNTSFISLYRTFLASSDTGQVIPDPSRSSTGGLITSPGTWVAAICVEHLYFRKGNFAHYDIQTWNVPSQLPLGAAALSACALSFALVIPSMSQVWYTGPIARTTGDIGFEMAVAVTTLLYFPLRHLEKRWRGV
jgi:purine-cytosine permease-like protein